MQKVNALILAGTVEFHKFDINNKIEYKQFHKLGKKKIIEYTINAVLKSKFIDSIFVIGNKEKLSFVKNKRITILSEQENVVDNIRYAINKIKDNKRLLITTSDCPLITEKDIDQFISTSNQKSDFVLGFSTLNNFNKVMDKLNLKVKSEKLKLGFFPIYKSSIRINNLFIIKPNKITNHLLDLARDINKNKSLLKTNGKTNLKSWKGIGHAFLKYFEKSKIHKITILRGVTRALLVGTMLLYAYKLRNFSINPFRFFVRPNRIEKVIWVLTDKQIHSQIHVSNIINPLIDIDVPETYHILANSGFRH